MNPDILITGTTGFIGSHLKAYFGSRATVLKADLTHPMDVLREVRKKDPSIIIHAAAKKEVKWCEENPEETFMVNSLGTSYIGCYAGARKFIFLSTDMVFSGKRGCYNKDDDTDPTTMYGRSKAIAEDFVKTLPNYAIVRTSAVYGWTKGNIFIQWLLRELGAGREVDVYENFYNSPTYVENLCEMIGAITDTPKNGIYHLAGGEKVSKYEFAIRLAGIMGYDPELVVPSKNEKKVDVSLDTTEDQKLINVDFNDIDTGIRRMMNEHKDTG